MVKILIGDYEIDRGKYANIIYVDIDDLKNLADWFDSVEFENVTTRNLLLSFEFNDYEIRYTDEQQEHYSYLFRQKKSKVDRNDIYKLMIK